MARKSWIGPALVVASAFGCNQIASIHDPVDKAAGSPDDVDAADGLDKFVGKWATAGSVLTLSNCTSPPASRVLRSDPSTLLLSRTASGTIVALVEGVLPACRIETSVSGNVASVLPDQICTFTGTVRSVRYTYSASTTFTISATDATMATLHFAATVFISPPGEQCSSDELDVFTKQQ